MIEDDLSHVMAAGDPKNSQIIKQTNIRIPDNRHGAAYGKPCFTKITYSTELVDVIEKDSAFFFTSFNIKTGFLSEPVADWSQIPSYIDGMTKVRSQQVVNDLAERAVRNASLFLSTAKKEERYQNNLQVAARNRKDLPSLRATKEALSAWFRK